MNINFINEWKQLNWRRFNWITFTPLALELEWEHYLGDVQVSIIVLGFGFRIYHHYLDTKEWLLIEKRIEKIGKGKEKLYKLETIYYPESQRLGQFIFNAIAKEYSGINHEDFHSILFHLSDKNLERILKKWRRKLE